MREPLITFTTDFGEASPYVAAMKGVVFSINPAARLIDLTHKIAPQDVRQAAFFLAEAIPFFPAKALHVVVVDPGVGTARNLLYLESGPHRLLGPDNGVFTLLERKRKVVRRLLLENRAYWRPEVSATFHGRDILAPVAAHLSLGVDPLLLGRQVHDSIHLPWPEPADEGERIVGEAVFVDAFGNLITNIPASLLPPEGPAKVLVEGQATPRWVRAYGEASAGELVALASSGDWLEVAEVNGHAARRLGVGVGARVHVWRRTPLA